jgi:hypothetical protein
MVLQTVSLMIRIVIIGHIHFYRKRLVEDLAPHVTSSSALAILRSRPAEPTTSSHPSSNSHPHLYPSIPRYLQLF